MDILLFIFRLLVRLFAKPLVIETAKPTISDNTTSIENTPPVIEYNNTVKKDIENPIKIKEKTPIDAILNWFEANGVQENTKPYRINIVGVRTSYKVTNKYDDIFYVWRYNDKSQLEYMIMDGTTKSGRYYALNPINTEGVAIIKANEHYKGVFQKAFHKGRPALKQYGFFKVYRDKNKDGVFDCVNLVTAHPNCAINMHYSTNSDYDLKSIDLFSAACQVLEKQTDWQRFWVWVEYDFLKYRELFDYTLIDSLQLS